MGRRAYFGQVVGTNRNILRQGGSYTCGMCRTSHKTESDALECLMTCYDLFLKSGKAVMRMRGRHLTYRCKLCGRDHKSFSLAASCFDRCERDQKDLFEKEIAALLQVDVQVIKKRPQKIQLVAAPQPVVKMKQKPIEDIAPDITSGHDFEITDSPVEPSQTEEPVATPAPAAAVPSPAVADTPAEAPKKKNGPAFYRDGARYVCNGCNAKYFTRGEVETCFASHT